VRTRRNVTLAVAAAVLAAIVVGALLHSTEGRAQPVLVTTPATLAPASSPSTVTSAPSSDPVKASQSAKLKSSPELHPVPTPQGQASFLFALGNPTVTTHQCPLPQVVNHTTIRPGEMVKPPEHASKGHASTDWCDTSVWETITGGKDPTLGVYPSSPSTGITFVNEHNCQHHQCPGTFITPTSITGADRMVLTTPTQILIYAPCAPPHLSQKKGFQQWYNCTDGGRPDAVNVVCFDEPGNPVELNTVWSFRLVEAHSR